MAIAVNPLKTKVLITTDEVIFHAPVDHEMDPRVLLQNILIAERRFIKPMLGSIVYQALLDAKNYIVTDGTKAALQTLISTNTQAGREIPQLQTGDIVNRDDLFTYEQYKLWHDYLHKITAECVWFVSLPVNRSRSTSKGVELNNPQSIASSQAAASISLGDLKHLMDRGLQDRISPLMDDMHGYLCGVAYPGYSKSCGCAEVEEPVGKKSDILFGLYEDNFDHRPRRKEVTRFIPGPNTGYIAKNETILFNDVASLDIPWTSQRIAKFGVSGSFYTELYNIDGTVRRTDVEAEPDSITDTTNYHFDFTDISTGRITIS